MDFLKTGVLLSISLSLCGQGILAHDVTLIETASTLTSQDDVATPPDAHHLLKPEPKSLIGYEVQCGVRQDRTRIVGGTSAAPGEFPWIVSIQSKALGPSLHVCGGAVVSSSWVITAGHCINTLKVNQLVVVAGEHDLISEEGTEQRRSVTRVVVRPDIDVGLFLNDVALLLVYPRLVLGERVAPICLPEVNRKFMEADGVIAGWGRMSEDGSTAQILQHATLPFIPIAQCHALFSGLGYTEYIHSNQLCLGLDAGGRDSCQGDSGGPLSCREGGRHYLCGIVSWGLGCARPQLPGIYTEVSKYSAWIRAVLYNENNVLNLNLVSRYPRTD